MPRRSGPCAPSAFAIRSSSRRSTGRPWNWRIPAMALMSVSLRGSSELCEPREGLVGLPDDHLTADFDPGMGGERTARARDAKAEPARDTAPAQHRLRGKRARQADGIHPRPGADKIDVS